MKYRIVPCVGAKVYYKIQVRVCLFWFNYGSVCNNFSSIDNAIAVAKEMLGVDAVRVDFEPT